MKVTFINAKTKEALAAYDSFIDQAELVATKDLLEYENSCKVIILIKTESGGGCK